MLTTKAYITSVPIEGDNKFTVNIPLMADNVNEEAIFEALLCSTSGNYNDYKVGDCVFVDFEDDKYNTAIIMGKLYTEVPEENEAYGLFNELKVTGSATLPEDTKIGRYTPQDIFNLYQAVSDNKNIDTDKFLDFDDALYYVNKDEFDEFYGSNYFNDDAPWGKSDDVVIDNTLESGTKDSEKIYNQNYNPNYSTLINDFKNFLQKKLNALFGLSTSGTTIPSISQIIAKMTAGGSQAYTGTNLDIDNPRSPVGENYFPNYTNLITHLKSFLSTDLINLVNQLKNWVNSLIGGLDNKYVQFNNDDTVKGKKVRVLTGNSYSSITTKDDDTLYFLTSVPSNNQP